MLIQIFCKAPIAGQVKTRLTPHLSQQQAKNLHQQLAWLTFTTVVQSSDTVSLYCSPDSKHPFFQQAQQQFGFNLATQYGDDLGQRMGLGLQQGLKQQQQVLLCGTDCPQLTPLSFKQAQQALNTVDVVFIPALDGGYVLIGVRRYHPDLFNNIDWGTEQVLQQNIRNVLALGYSYQCLAPLADIDRPTDLPLLPADISKYYNDGKASRLL